MEETNGIGRDTENKIAPTTVLFFDMDGTLVDTNLANFLSYKRAINSVTKSDFNLIYNPNKRFNRSILEIAIPNLSITEYKKIIQKKEECYKDFLAETKLNETIAKILFKYSKANKTVLVTNCRKDRVLMTLNHFGLASEFDNIFCREITDNDRRINKFENAISKLGISPNLIFAFENEDIEIADARQAGIEIINPVIGMNV